MISLSEFPAYLNSLTRAEWQPLIDLIPEIDQTTVSGKESGFDPTESDIQLLILVKKSTVKNLITY